LQKTFSRVKKGDPQHDPTVNSCLVRIPGTINSKCAQLTRHFVNREEQAKPIAQTSKVISMINELNYAVISKSCYNTYTVHATQSGRVCSCPDHICRDIKCKHVYAVNFIIDEMC
jgi:hypothetical protein